MIGFYVPPALRIAVWVIGIPIIALLIKSIALRLRAIRELDTQLREEEAQNAMNPYAAMAQLYEQRELEQLLDKARRKR